MNEDIREKIYVKLVERMSEYLNNLCRQSIMDIARYGFVGIDTMDDAQLIDQYREWVLYGEEDDELIREAEASLALDNMLSDTV